MLRLNHDHGCVRKDRKREAGPVTPIGADVDNTTWHKTAIANVFEKVGYCADCSAAIATNLDSKPVKSRFNCRLDSVLHTTKFSIERCDCHCGLAKAVNI